jgi:hypothetical protein
MTAETVEDGFKLVALRPGQRSTHSYVRILMVPQKAPLSHRNRVRLCLRVGGELYTRKTGEIIEPAEVIAQPEAFRCIEEEVSETLDYRPAKFFRNQIIRRKSLAT